MIEDIVEAKEKVDKYFNRIMVFIFITTLSIIIMFVFNLETRSACDCPVCPTPTVERYYYATPEALGNFTCEANTNVLLAE